MYEMKFQRSQLFNVSGRIVRDWSHGDTASELRKNRDTDMLM